MNNCTITRNEQFNSFELLFNGKPDEKTRELLKANGYRWHGVRRLWYGYKDIAEQLNGATIETEQPKTARNEHKPAERLPLWERTRTDKLPAYGTNNKLKTQARERARERGSGYDKEAAAIIRAHLRARFPEVKFSVTSGGAGYLHNCDIRIISSPYGRELIKGDPSAYDWRDRYDHNENSDELQAVLDYCKALHNAFDGDDGDIYADYGAHHDIYGGAEIDWQFTQTEQTPEIIADCADFAAKKAAHEKAEQERRDREFEEQQRQEEIDRQKAEEQRKRDEQTAAAISEHITVTDLPESEQIVVTDLIGGIGKEDSLDELRQTIAEIHETHTDAVITRTVKFTSAELFSDFCNMFMRDWEFLRGMGGTATEDERIKTPQDLNKLTAEQSKKISFYSCNCVAVYLNDVLQLVIDPQGFDYARYLYLPDPEKSLTWTATEYREALREESTTAAPFYCPAPLAEQLEAAQLREGETVTILYISGWTICTQRIAGKLISAQPTKYAQYTDAARIEYIPQGKRKPDTIITHTGEDFLLYRGELPEIPRDMAYTHTGGFMYRNNTAGEYAHDFIRQARDHFKAQGYEPIINTIPA